MSAKTKAELLKIASKAVTTIHNGFVGYVEDIAIYLSSNETGSFASVAGKHPEVAEYEAENKIKKNTPYIVLNRHDCDGHPFSAAIILAHELGHIKLGHIFLDKDVIENEVTKIDSQFEIEADHFADTVMGEGSVKLFLESVGRRVDRMIESLKDSVKEETLLTLSRARQQIDYRLTNLA